ncbi:hypothetical protein [Mycobacterium gastri]|uniref:hypothetical protein n=1 Tax=Mycobacterium gastri TaxID=1777 RepID=UPI00111C15EE|nr:hypothetical protein [Mycobacterium gastri]
MALLTWQLLRLRTGPAPKLSPVVGLLTPDGLVTNDAGSQARTSLENATERESCSPFRRADGPT